MINALRCADEKLYLLNFGHSDNDRDRIDNDDVDGDGDGVGQWPLTILVAIMMNMILVIKFQRHFVNGSSAHWSLSFWTP